MSARMIGTAISGCSSSSAVNSQAGKRRHSVSIAATTDAERGCSSISASSPKKSPAFTSPSRLAAALDAAVAAQDDVERRAGRALADDLLVRRVGAALPGLGEAVPNAAIEPREQRHRCELLLELHRRDPPCELRS